MKWLDERRKNRDALRDLDEHAADEEANVIIERRSKWYMNRSCPLIGRPCETSKCAFWNVIKINTTDIHNKPICVPIVGCLLEREP